MTKNLLVDWLNKTGVTNFLTDVQNLANKTSATNVNTVNTPNTPTKPEFKTHSTNMKTAVAPTPTAPAPTGLQPWTSTGNWPAFIDGQLRTPANNEVLAAARGQNTQQSRFIWFQQQPQQPTYPNTTLWGNQMTLLDKVNDGKYYTILSNEQKAMNANRKEQEKYRTTSEALMDFQWDVLKNNGKMTEEQMKSRYPEFADKVDVLKELQTELRPIVQGGMGVDADQLAQYYPELLQAKKIVNTEEAKKKSEKAEKTYQELKKRNDKILKSNWEWLSANGVKFARDANTLFNAVELAKQEWVVWGANDDEILSYIINNNAEAKAVWDEMRSLELTGEDKAMYGMKWANYLENLSAAISSLTTKKSDFQPTDDEMESVIRGKEALDADFANSTLKKISTELWVSADSLEKKIYRAYKDWENYGLENATVAFDLALPKSYWEDALWIKLSDKNYMSIMGLFDSVTAPARNERIQQNKQNVMDYTESVNREYEGRKAANLNPDIENYVNSRSMSNMLLQWDLQPFLYKSSWEAAQNVDNLVIMGLWIAAPEIVLPLMAADSYARESQESFEELMEVQKKAWIPQTEAYDNAQKWSVMVWLASSAVEIRLEKVLWWVETTASKAFHDILVKDVAERTTKMVAERWLADLLKQWLTTQFRASFEEWMEEVFQQAIHNSSLKKYDPDQKITEWMLESFEWGFYNWMNLLAWWWDVLSNVQQNSNSITQSANQTAYQWGAKARDIVNGLNQWAYNAGKETRNLVNITENFKNKVTSQGGKDNTQQQWQGIQVNTASENGDNINWESYTQKNKNSNTLNKVQIWLLKSNNRMNPVKITEFQDKFWLDYWQALADMWYTESHETNVPKIEKDTKEIYNEKKKAMNSVEWEFQDRALADMLEIMLQKATNTKDYDMIDKYERLTQKHNEEWLTMAEANDMREEFSYKIKTRWNTENNSDKIDLANNVYSAVKTFLEKTAEANGIKDLQKMNRDIAMRKYLSTWIGDKAERQSANNMVSLTDWVMIAEAASSPYALAWLVTKKIAQQPKVKNAVLNAVVWRRENRTIDQQNRQATNRERMESIESANEGRRLQEELSIPDIPALPNWIKLTKVTEINNPKNKVTSKKKSDSKNNAAKKTTKSVDKKGTNEYNTTDASSNTSPVSLTEKGEKATWTKSVVSEQRQGAEIQEDIPATFSKKTKTPTQWSNFDISWVDKEYSDNYDKIVSWELVEWPVGKIDWSIAFDGKERPAIFSQTIKDKIDKDHSLNKENLLWTIDKPDYIIKDFDKVKNPDKDKINLIRKIPWTNNFVLVAAERQNGFFILTNYEIHRNNANQMMKEIRWYAKRWIIALDTIWDLTEALNKVTWGKNAVTSQTNDILNEETPQNERGQMEEIEAEENLRDNETPQDTVDQIINEEQYLIDTKKYNPRNKNVAERKIKHETPKEKDIWTDSNGEEVTFYHGTPQWWFEEFSMDFRWKSNDRVWNWDYGRWMYFTPYKETAEWYAKSSKAESTNPEIYETKLRMENPLRLDLYKEFQRAMNKLAKEDTARWYSLLSKEHSENIDRLMKEFWLTEELYDKYEDIISSLRDNRFDVDIRGGGFDGIISEDWKEVIVPDTDQIIIQRHYSTNETAQKTEITQPTKTISEQRTEWAKQERERLDNNWIKPAKSLPKGHKWTEEWSFTVNTPNWPKLTFLPIWDDLYIKNWEQVRTKDIKNTVIENYKRFSANELTNFLNDDLTGWDGDAGGQFVTEAWHKLGLPLWTQVNILKPLNPKERKNVVTEKAAVTEKNTTPKAKVKQEIETKPVENSDLREKIWDRFYDYLQKQVEIINESRKWIAAPITINDLKLSDYIDRFEKIAQEEVKEIQNELDEVTKDLPKAPALTESQKNQLSKATNQEERNKLLRKWQDEWLKKNPISDEKMEQIRKIMDRAAEVVEWHKKARNYLYELEIEEENRENEDHFSYDVYGDIMKRVEEAENKINEEFDKKFEEEYDSKKKRFDELNEDDNTDRSDWSEIAKLANDLNNMGNKYDRLKEEAFNKRYPDLVEEKKRQEELFSKDWKKTYRRAVWNMENNNSKTKVTDTGKNKVTNPTKSKAASLFNESEVEKGKKSEWLNPDALPLSDYREMQRLKNEQWYPLSDALEEKSIKKYIARKLATELVGNYDEIIADEFDPENIEDERVKKYNDVIDMYEAYEKWDSETADKFANGLIEWKTAKEIVDQYSPDYDTDLEIFNRLSKEYPWFTNWKIDLTGDYGKALREFANQDNETAQDIDYQELAEMSNETAQIPTIFEEDLQESNIRNLDENETAQMVEEEEWTDLTTQAINLFKNAEPWTVQYIGDDKKVRARVGFDGSDIVVPWEWDYNAVMFMPRESWDNMNINLYDTSDTWIKNINKVLSELDIPYTVGSEVDAQTNETKYYLENNLTHTKAYFDDNGTSRLKVNKNLKGREIVPRRNTEQQAEYDKQVEQKRQEIEAERQKEQEKKRKIEEEQAKEQAKLNEKRQPLIQYVDEKYSDSPMQRGRVLKDLTEKNDDSKHKIRYYWDDVADDAEVWQVLDALANKNGTFHETWEYGDTYSNTYRYQDPELWRENSIHNITKTQKDYMEYRMNQNPKTTTEITWEKNAVTAKQVENKEAPKENKETNTEVELLPEDVSVYTEAEEMWSKRIAPDRVPRQQLTFEEWVNNIAEKLETLAEYKRVSKQYYTSDWYNDSELFRRLDELKEEFQNIMYWNKGFQFRSNKSKEFIELWKNIVDNKDNPTALREVAKNFYISKVKKDISKWYMYPQAVLDKIPWAKKAVNNRERYQKGLDTSFSAKDERIDYSEKDKIWAWLKSQDWKQITKEQKEDIVKWILDFGRTMGLDMKKFAEDRGLVYVHLHWGSAFLKNAAWLYREFTNAEWDKNISVSVWGMENVRHKNKRTWEWETDTLNTTMSHELGHAMDYLVDNNLFTWSQKAMLWSKYNPVQRLRNYYAKWNEIVARAIEQYVAVENGQPDYYIENWNLDAGDLKWTDLEYALKEVWSYYERPWYWSKPDYEKYVKPYVEEAFKNNFDEYRVSKKNVLSNDKNKVTSRK